MRNSCCDAAYGGDYPEFLVERMVKSRKEHKCCECRETINKNEMYEKVTGMWDGRISTFKTCKICKTIREDYFCTWNYGNLSEDLWDCLEVELK